MSQKKIHQTNTQDAFFKFTGPHRILVSGDSFSDTIKPQTQTFSSQVVGKVKIYGTIKMYGSKAGSLKPYASDSSYGNE